jgi:hypothetical protein
MGKEILKLNINLKRQRLSKAFKLSAGAICHLVPDQLAHAASRLNSMFVGYDSATLHQNEKRPPSLAAA